LLYANIQVTSHFSQSGVAYIFLQYLFHIAAEIKLWGLAYNPAWLHLYKTVAAEKNGNG
jgi:hypothetical protein